MERPKSPLACLYSVLQRGCSVLLLRNAARWRWAWHDQPRVDGVTLGSYCQPWFAQRFSLQDVRSMRGWHLSVLWYYSVTGKGSQMLCKNVLQRAMRPEGLSGGCPSPRKTRWLERSPWLLWRLVEASLCQICAFPKAESTPQMGESPWRPWSTFSFSSGGAGCGGWSAVVYLNCV